jgi:AbrB family looped-hinge helix DNA binding protein
MGRAITVRADKKGRLTIPLKIREELGVEPGTMFTVEREGNTLRLAKAENPFDGLARHAIEEYQAGRTKNLREFARENNISLDAE